MAWKRKRQEQQLTAATPQRVQPLGVQTDRLPSSHPRRGQMDCQSSGLPGKGLQPRLDDFVSSLPQLAMVLGQGRLQALLHLPFDLSLCLVRAQHHCPLLLLLLLCRCRCPLRALERRLLPARRSSLAFSFWALASGEEALERPLEQHQQQPQPLAQAGFSSSSSPPPPPPHRGMVLVLMLVPLHLPAGTAAASAVASLHKQQLGPQGPRLQRVWWLPLQHVPPVDDGQDQKRKWTFQDLVRCRQTQAPRPRRQQLHVCRPQLDVGSRCRCMSPPVVLASPWRAHGLDRPSPILILGPLHRIHQWVSCFDATI